MPRGKSTWCYDEFPISTVIYNLTVAGGVIALGAVVAAQFGVGLLLGDALLLAIALVGIMATTCARCEGYYGRRCGLGLGKVVPLLFKQGQPHLYLRTPMQFVYVILLLVALVWPIAGSAILMARDASGGRLVQFGAAIVLLLALAAPHPRIVCRHCRQGAGGGCPIGQKIQATRGEP